MLEKKILDPCCAGRMFYFDKQDSRVLFCDIRNFEIEFCDNRHYEVKPDLQIDFTNTPFRDNYFNLVIFDPPHLLCKQVNPTAYLKIKYGTLHPETWQETIRKGFSECFRVLKPGGVLIFKWSEVDIKTSEILKLTPYKALIGQRNGKRGIWITFIKD